MQLLSKFLQTSWIGMLKTVIKVRISCPVVFLKRIGVFKLKKISQIGTEIYKKHISNFQSFYADFVKFMTDFVDWNVENGQQGKSLLSSSLL